jgi:hypothetical protein
MLELERFAILLIDICLVDSIVNKNPSLSRINLEARVPQVSILRPGNPCAPKAVLKGHGFSRTEWRRKERGFNL